VLCFLFGMPTNQYQFVSRWRVEGTCGEVADILGDASSLARWWPSVYLDVQQLEPPDSRGVGRRVALVTKGWLPYALRWEFRVVESRYPHGFSLVATGDFDGRGVWVIEQTGRFVEVTYDWRVSAKKPLLRNFSFVLKPLFEANHRWAMARGEESLKLELLRRRATSDVSRAALPPPPGPITYSGIALVAGAAAIAGTLAYLLARSARRRKPRGKTGDAS
jgi:hypothetical protein